MYSDYEIAHKASDYIIFRTEYEILYRQFSQCAMI